MSRIEEALRRAGQKNPAAASATPGEAAENVAMPPDEPKDGDGAGQNAAAAAPWNFDETEAALPHLPVEPRLSTQTVQGGPRDGRSAAAKPSPLIVRPARQQMPSRARQAAAVQREESPHISLLTPTRQFGPAFAERLVVTDHIRPASVEQYRKLAATLHHAQAEHGTKLVMVTSALAGDGKTLTAVNLALTFSESYQRDVLLIDADLRRPQLHEVFQLPNVSGLGDGLRAESDSKLSLIQVSRRLSVLTAGRPDPDPMSGLTSNRMRRVIDEAAERFDWVVIDTPPVGLLPDANLLAAMVDCAVLVIRAGDTPFELVQRAVDAVGRDRIIGVVLNGVDDGIGAVRYDYHYYTSYAGPRSR